MKTKLLLIFFLICFADIHAYAQDTIAGWTFPSGISTDVTPDFHNANNAADSITALGGTSAINWKYGVTTYAAQATGWDGGANLKYWQIEINTTGYENLLLYSIQTGGNANPGPRDWKAQYSIGTSGIWIDIPNTVRINTTDWESAKDSNISIPSACNDQPSILIRWIMTSDTSVAPHALVASTGTTKIDDIFILGTYPSFVQENSLSNSSVYPNPTTGIFTIAASQPVTDVEVFNLLGKLVYSNHSQVPNPGIDLSGFEKGVYFIRYKINGSDKTEIEKIMIQ